MPLVLESVTFAVADPDAVARFWGSLVDREVRQGDPGALLPGRDGQVGLRFVPRAGPDGREERMHLHLFDAGRTQREHIEHVLALGGRLRGSGRVPPGGYAAMADPVGDPFCVIENGNSFLDGCGPLGEVTCDGPREVGVFWSAALGWPLVWDHDGETAVQQTPGGTKLSWSGDRTDPELLTDHQSFDLVAPADEFDRELSRLEALGARRRSDPAPGIGELSDPGGMPFRVRPSR